ncbi:MAG: hypothetical protein D3923_15955 [Candidatus Electrothrix sp. AR3]|nr:hypothetical protein [Candidatus Electrothrix sp. AR3]
MGELPLWIEDDKKKQDGRLGNSRSGRKEKAGLGSISTEKLRDSITALSGEFSHIIKDAKAVGGFKLKEVQIQVGIDAQAGVVLIGKAGIKGSITLTFSEE